MSWAFQELNKQLLVCEDKPVVTRFWLFGSCVQKLWLMQALCLPASIWKTGTTVPREENARRLRGFKQFYTDPGSQRRLRIAVLDLQLTSYAVNISSQKPKPADEHNSTKPLLVRLGGQEIQTKTESLFWIGAFVWFGEIFLNVTKTNKKTIMHVFRSHRLRRSYAKFSLVFYPRSLRCAM